MQGMSKALHRLADQRELRHRSSGGVGPVRLVVGVDLVAEGLRRIVEDDGDMRRLVVRAAVSLMQLPEHVAEARARAPTGSPSDLRVSGGSAWIGAENVARAVDQEEMVALAHGAVGAAVDGGISGIGMRELVFVQDPRGYWHARAPAATRSVTMTGKLPRSRGFRPGFAADEDGGARSAGPSVL